MTPPQEISIYFHIPFCTRKCDYCHFYVLPDKEPLKIALMEGLELEWEKRLPLLQGKEIVSIYFGGGTPALLGPKRLSTILSWIQKPFNLKNAEITLEANPENIDLPLMKAYRDVGVNRISIGVQTLSDPLLSLLGRTHNGKKACDAVSITQIAGFDNISMDLMYDIPDQTLRDWEKTLQVAISLPITHLSLYNLTLEPHTVFFKKKEQLLPRLPSEETSLEMYEMAKNAFTQAKFTRYEISAFCKPLFHSRHNSGYWSSRPFLGFGPSAFSYWNKSRFKNISHLKKYQERLKMGENPVDFVETLEPDASRRELLAIALRQTEGIDLFHFQHLHGNLKDDTWKVLKELEEKGLLCKWDSQIALTDRGILCYDIVATEII